MDDSLKIQFITRDFYHGYLLRPYPTSKFVRITYDPDQLNTLRVLINELNKKTYPAICSIYKQVTFKVNTTTNVLDHDSANTFSLVIEGLIFGNTDVLLPQISIIEKDTIVLVSLDISKMITFLQQHVRPKQSTSLG